MTFPPKNTIRRVIGIGTLLIAGWIGFQVSRVAEAQSTQTPSKPSQPDKKPATIKNNPGTPSNTSNKSGIPEETQIQLVNQFSDQLAVKIQKASCPEVGTLLDQIKESGNKPQDPDSLVGRVLEDMKSNPKLKAIVVQKLGEPMMNRLLDCNMVPLDWIKTGT
jgi:hypothetical protein